MNYSGHDELRQDIAALSNDMHELYQRIKLLEQHQSDAWSCRADITDCRNNLLCITSTNIRTGSYLLRLNNYP